jgi:hypothetical protein
MHLTPTQYIPWMGSVLVEVGLLAIMLRRKLVRRFPFFFASIAYDVCRQIVLFVIMAKFAAAYFAAYWLLMPAEYTLAFAVIYEAFRSAFKTDIRFSPNILKVFGIATALLVLIAAAFVLHPGVPIRSFSILILVLDRSTELLRCALLLFLWVFSAKLGITWRHHVWGIVFGLALYAGVSLITAIMDVVLGKTCGYWLVPIPHFAYLAATLIWTFFLLKKEPVTEPLTLEELQGHLNFIAFLHSVLMEVRRLMRDRL